ncbi:serine hydrolase [Paenibacillus selenitireducens]|uniref:serine hydrolase n=1 Tax=Paenibacillus selenitireducens TaxID=1324314 RepID=UPI0038CDB346
MQLPEKSGNRLLSKGWGLANREHLVPNQIETKFRIGSVSKQFTAAAILLLQEHGKLSIKIKIRDIFYRLRFHCNKIPEFCVFFLGVI